MRFQLLATDYDGTLADGGKVDNRTLEALGRLRASGRRLVLISGRHLPSLSGVFPQLDLFDRVVAENGALRFRQGELSPGQSFYFRGPESKSNLRAQNLRIFLQLAEGVDDVTWMYHLRRGDYSEWFRSMIKDAELASCTAEVEGDATASPQQSRQRIKEAVERRYTAPA